MGNQTIFDNTLFPLPTLTPPAGMPEEPMNYNFLPPASSHAASSFYGMAPPSITSSSIAGNASKSDFHAQTFQQDPSHKSGNHNQPPPVGHQQQQLALPSLTSNLNHPMQQQSASSSYVNFNLSTLFPEINFVPEKLTPLPNHPPVSQSGSHKSNNSSAPVGTTAGSTVSTASSSLSTVPNPADLRQLTTPELLPHSIAILGHPTHQVAAF